jgi:hypothetical protein
MDGAVKKPLSARVLRKRGVGKIESLSITSKYCPGSGMASGGQEIQAASFPLLSSRISVISPGWRRMAAWYHESGSGAINCRSMCWSVF